MTSSAALLTAMRLSDSMLPVGTYTASYGVEQYLNEGEIETADESDDDAGEDEDELEIADAETDDEANR